MLGRWGDGAWTKWGTGSVATLQYYIWTVSVKPNLLFSFLWCDPRFHRTSLQNLIYPCILIIKPAIAAMHGSQSVFDIGHCTVINRDAESVSLVDQWKAEKNWFSFNWPINRCFFKPIKVGVIIGHYTKIGRINQHWWAVQFEQLTQWRTGE